MQLIQFMPLIKFNVCYTLHSNTNNNRPSNNLLFIDFMLLIQFMLLIIGGFCDRDLYRQAAATAERLWTDGVQSCLWQSYFPWSNCLSHEFVSGSGWIIIGKRFTIITCGPKWLKFTTINHWHLCQFSAKRGVQCATATAVLSVPTAPSSTCHDKPYRSVLSCILENLSCCV